MRTKMKKWLNVLCLILILFISGCAMGRIKTPTLDILYLRIGEQRIGRLSIKTPKGIEATLKDQKASADELIKALRGLDPITVKTILAILAGI